MADTPDAPIDAVVCVPVGPYVYRYERTGKAWLCKAELHGRLFLKPAPASPEVHFILDALELAQARNAELQRDLATALAPAKTMLIAGGRRGGKTQQLRRDAIASPFSIHHIPVVPDPTVPPGEFRLVNRDVPLIPETPAAADAAPVSDTEPTP